MVRYFSLALTSLNILVVGGTASVSSSVEKALSSYGKVADRFDGADRYETNRMVYEYGFAHGGWSIAQAFLASGAKFPDALTIAPYLMWAKVPIVLVNPAATSLTSAQAAIVEDASQVIALGGTSAVTDELLASAKAACKGNSADRLGGFTRYATSAIIVEWELAHGMQLEGAGFATGEAFPDALASSYLLGSTGSVLGLVHPKGENENMMGMVYTAASKRAPSSIRVFGGTASVPTAVRAQIAQALGWPSYTEL